MGKFLDSLRRSVSVSKRPKTGDQQNVTEEGMQKEGTSPLKPTKLALPGSADKGLKGNCSPPADRLRAVRAPQTKLDFTSSRSVVR